MTQDMNWTQVETPGGSDQKTPKPGMVILMYTQYLTRVLPDLNPAQTQHFPTHLSLVLTIEWKQALG